MTRSGPPIFVVGCHRSGTTMLRLILDAHPKISCGPETRFLADLAKVTGENWPRMRLFGLSKESWHARFAELFESFQLEYAHSRGKSRWADKTPLYAKHLPFIDALFPDAQIVHIIRDGRDVVSSHRERFGYLAAVKATEKWPRYIRTAREFGLQLGPDRYLEMRYEDVIADTPAALKCLLDFVGEPWDDAVLAHEGAPHDVTDSYREFSGRRREASGQEHSVYRSRVGSHRVEMDPLLRGLVRWRSGRQLRELGYD